MNLRALRTVHGGPLVVLALFSLVLVGVATHQWQSAPPRLRAALPAAISGDEPHILLMVHSVLFDGDLLLQNNYADCRRGGPEAGHQFRGSNLDPHVYLVPQLPGPSLLWQDYYSLVPTAIADSHGFAFEPIQPNPLAPGTYEWMPSHAPAYALFVAALLKPLQLTPEQVEPAFGLIVLGLAIAGLFIAYGTGLAAGLTRWESVMAVALFAFCSPWLVYTRSFYTGIPVSLLLLLALWAHLRGRPVPAAICLGLVTWLKPAAVVFGMALLVERLWMRRWRDAFILAALQGVSGLALIAFNLNLSGLPLISGSSPLTYRFDPTLVLNILFDPGGGLILFVPWVLMALAAPFASREHALPPGTRLALLLPLCAHLLLMTGYTTLGSSYGPRYWNFVLPWMAILIVGWTRGRAVPVRVALVLAAFVGAMWAIPAVLQYDVALWCQPPHLALWRLLGW